VRVSIEAVSHRNPSPLRKDNGFTAVRSSPLPPGEGSGKMTVMRDHPCQPLTVQADSDCCRPIRDV